jgi:hypothetical protein
MMVRQSSTQSISIIRQQSIHNFLDPIHVVLSSVGLSPNASKNNVVLSCRVLVNISKTQDMEVGDGTTSVCVLAAELLREAEKLVQAKIHPQTIIAGMCVVAEWFWIIVSIVICDC